MENVMLCDGDINLQSLLIPFDEVSCYKNEEKVTDKKERSRGRINSCLWLPNIVKKKTCSYAETLKSTFKILHDRCQVRRGGGG